jgi:hypothetical protein
VLTSREPQRATLVEHVIELPSLVGRFLRRPTCGLGLSTPISRRTTKCAIDTTGTNLVATNEHWDKNHRVNLVHPIGLQFPIQAYIYFYIYYACVVALVIS